MLLNGGPCRRCGNIGGRAINLVAPRTSPPPTAPGYLLPFNPPPAITTTATTAWTPPGYPNLYSYTMLSSGLSLPAVAAAACRADLLQHGVQIYRTDDLRVYVATSRRAAHACYINVVNDSWRVNVTL